MGLLTSQKWTILEESYEDMNWVEKKEMDKMEDMINKLYGRVIYRQYEED